MTILITGGAGYIGSHVVRQMSEAGYQVVVFDNLSTGSAESLLYGEHLIKGDLSDKTSLELVFNSYQIDAVLHFAASISVSESVANPLKYYANNTGNTMNLLEFCVRHNVKKFVFSSTAAVYGVSETGIVSEDSPTVPINPYGKSKLMSESILKDTAQVCGLRYAILRYFNVAGADPKGRMGQRSPNANHLIKVCCEAALGHRDCVQIYGTNYNTPDGTGVRDYIHVEDLANAHLAALNYLDHQKNCIILNVGYGWGSSVREVVGMVKKISGVDFGIVETCRRPGDAGMLVAKVDRIEQELGWKPSYGNLETIVKDAWHWEQKQTNCTATQQLLRY